MIPRTCILMSILGFTVVHVAALFKGQPITTTWLTALVVMVLFAILGLFMGWAYEALIKETMIQEESLLFSEYLEKNPEAGGPGSSHDVRQDDESETDEEGEGEAAEMASPQQEA